MNKKLNLEIGTKFGKWEITSERTQKISNLTNWICTCECGHEQFVPLNNLMNGSSTQCNSCGHIESGKKRRKGHELISGDMWSQIKNNAEKKDILFNLRIEEAWDIFVSQDNKCKLSAFPIKLSGYPYDKENTTAKLQLLLPQLGYKKDNVIWVHKDVSKMIGNYNVDKFLMIAEEVYLHTS